MKSFFKTFFAAFLALIIFSFLGFFILIGIAAAFSSDEKVAVAPNSVLVIDASETFLEQSKNDPFSELLNKKNGKQPSLSELIGLLNYAKKDSNIKGVYIKCSENPNGYAATEEIRKAIIDFKKSNKFVVAYAETISQKGYMMGNVADQIYTHPQGGLEWSGFNYETIFLKGLIDKLEIEPQIFYAGKFKSATEPFRYTQMSEANKLQTMVWLNSIYNNFIHGAADMRHLNADSIKAFANEGKVQNAKDALKFKLVDGLLYDDQLKKIIAKKLQLTEASKISFVTINDYASNVTLRGTGSGKIAVIYADGDVVMGKGEKDAIASDDYKALIQKIRNDKTIDAVVLRVNSPGGSALASDIIWREIDLLKKEKPVIVSMGNLAASGGYYISCGADSIFADANTITGSIGVFSVIPNAEKFLKNKLGITFDRVKTGQYADAPSATRALTVTEQKFLQSGVDSVYYTFKSRVAAGRQKSIEYIDSIAQGRVWTGVDAIKIGLVDKIGSLNDAVASAAKMAKVKGYSIKAYPENRSIIEEFIDGYKNEVKTKVMQQELGLEQWQVIQQIKSIKHLMGQPQARLPIFELYHR